MAISLTSRTGKEAKSERMSARLSSPLAHTHTVRAFLVPAMLLALALAHSGCPRVIALDYQPANPLKGVGHVQVEPFVYLAAKRGDVRSHEVESNPEGVGKLFLSQHIGVLFADALKSELTHSGYDVAQAPDRVVTGEIQRFYLDWVGEANKTFTLEVEYQITSAGKQIYTQSARSSQKGAKDLLVDIRLITHAMRDCIEQFIRGAQAAQAL